MSDLSPLPPTVHLTGLGQSLPLILPRSHAVRYEIWEAFATNTNRAFSAALGVCLKGVIIRAKYTGDVMAYGGQVFDELIAMGVPRKEIQQAGSDAWVLIARACQDAPTEAEVKDTTGFSEAGGPSTTS